MFVCGWVVCGFVRASSQKRLVEWGSNLVGGCSLVQLTFLSSYDRSSLHQLFFFIFFDVLGRMRLKLGGRVKFEPSNIIEGFSGKLL